MRTSRVSVTAVGLLALLIGVSALAQDKSPSRYPFDPSCPWGRLANGKGMIVRCLTESEAIQLSSARGSAQTIPVPASNAALADNPSSTKKPSVALDSDVISVTADEGTLATARKKLRSPREQYSRCVAENGGLSADAGEVTIRFLVRERGRAEGASVEKRVGMGDAAARCIAAVVDRRPVGTPEGPVVGATAVIRVTKPANR